MSIREATIADLPAIAAMGGAFYAEANLPGRFNPDVWVSSWSAILKAHVGRIWAAEDATGLVGTIGILVAPDLGSGDLTATEGFWFVTPKARGAGVRLLKSAEEWARKSGLKRFLMAHTQLGKESLGKLYSRLGYTELETTWEKTL